MRVGDHLYELFKTHDQTKSSLLIKKLVKEVFQKGSKKYISQNGISLLKRNCFDTKKYIRI